MSSIQNKIKTEILKRLLKPNQNITKFDHKILVLVIIKVIMNPVSSCINNSMLI